MANFAQLLEKLAAADSPSAQAALVAESAFAQLDPTVARVARCCIVLRWFDPLIVATFLPATSETETAFTPDTVINHLAQLPFVERLPWGWTYHEQSRTGLLDRYAMEQPDLLKQAALLAASAYQQHPNQALAGQEALFCWLIAGYLDKAQQQLDRLLDEAWWRKDWNGLLALFITSDQAAKLSFVQSLQRTAFHHYAQAVALRQLGNYDEAIVAYQQVIALDEKFASPWNGLGNAYRDLKRYDEAVAAYQQAIALDEKFAIAWSNLGLAYRDLKRYAEAVAAYQQAIALDEKFAYHWNGLGNVYTDQKRYDDAVAAIQQAIAIEDKDADYWSNLGLVRRILQQWREAEIAVRHALALAPTDWNAWFALADILRRLGDQAGWQEALAKARPLIDYNDFYNAACFESVAGNVERAIALLTQAAAQARFNGAWAQEDPDLAWIRHDPRFAQIVKGA